MVRLVIKAPNQKIDDFSLTADLSWTVRQLKHHLSVNYPSRPPASDQRLIHAGHLMQDDHTLNHVFHSNPANEENEDTVTLHLVCSNPTATSSSSSSQQPAAASQTSRSSGSSVPTTSQPAVRAGISSSMPLGPVSAAAATSAFPLMAQMQMQSPLLTWTPQQLALAHDMYQQFMRQLQANPHTLPSLMAVPSLSTGAGASVAPASVVPPPLPVPNPAAAAPAPAAAPLPVNNNNNLINHNNNVVNNVPPPPAAVPDDDEEEDEDDLLEERDFLGWFYWMSRAVVLFSVVYFYSSMARLIVVLLFAVLMYIYQTGMLMPRDVDQLLADNQLLAAADNNNAVNAEDAANVQIQQQHHQQEAQPEPAVAAAAAANTARRRASDMPQVTERNGLRMAWLIVSSLFTSLIPEQPPAHF